MKKVGIIRCQQIEDLCQGRMDFKVAAEGLKAFEKYGPVEVVGFASCGGCPGKKVAYRAQNMVEKHGAEVIAFASCMGKGLHAFPCPFFKEIVEHVKQRVGDKVEILEWTH